MKASCPNCGANFDLDAAVSTADAKRLTALVAELRPPVAKGLLGYLTLFRTASGQLRPATQLKIAEELKAYIEAGSIVRNRRRIQVNDDIWSAAFHQILQRAGGLSLPLKGNGYFLEIVAGLAGQYDSVKEQATERERQQRGRTAEAPPRSAAELCEQQMREQWDKELGL